MRAGSIDRASTLKPGEGLTARIPDRVEDVVQKVRVSADELGLAPDLAERHWHIPVYWSIAREEYGIGTD